MPCEVARRVERVAARRRRVVRQGEAGGREQVTRLVSQGFLWRGISPTVVLADFAYAPQVQAVGVLGVVNCGVHLTKYAMVVGICCARACWYARVALCSRGMMVALSRAAFMRPGRSLVRRINGLPAAGCRAVFDSQGSVFESRTLMGKC